MATKGSDESDPESNPKYQIPGSGSFAQPMDPSVTHYQILGIRHGATEDEITKAFRQKARIYHPDKTGSTSSEEWMKRINEAKSVLLSEKREVYDEKLADEGQAVIDPAGFLPDGTRLSLEFLQFFKSCKMSFEAGFVWNLQDFPVILQKEFRGNPKPLPALPFTSKPPKRSGVSTTSTRHANASPLTDVLNEMDATLSAPQLSSVVGVQCKELQSILQMTKVTGTSTTLPVVDGQVPIISFSNVPDKPLASFLALFEEPKSGQSGPGRSAMLSSLEKLVPYTSVQQPAPESKPQPTNCTTCNKWFTFFAKAKHTCYHCKAQFCKQCPPDQVVVPRIGLEKARPFCSNCLQQFTRSDIEDWTNYSIKFVEVGTVESIKAAMVCLMVAMCLSESSTKPIIRVARSLFNNGLPEHAMPFVTTILQHSEDTREILGAYVLSAQIFKSLADESVSDPEIQWEHLLAAKDSINHALEQASRLDSGVVEIPNYTAIKKDVNDSLYLVKEQQEHIEELEVIRLCLEMEDLWQKRESEDLLALVLDEDSAITSSFLPCKESVTVDALERFLVPKCGFLDRMLEEDRIALVFFRGVLKILKKRPSDGLIDIGEAAFSGHHHEWLREAVNDVFISFLAEEPSLLFPPDSIREALKGKQLLNDDTFPDRLGLLFPKKNEITPPHKRNWPELSVTGLNIKGHTKFEKAIFSQVEEGNWDEKDVAMAYIDYVPACGHPAEVALCFLNAAMWLLKHLQANLGSSPLSEMYATKEVIMRCLKHSLAIAYMSLHPGMQLYVSRLCFGTALQTMRLTESFGNKEDVELVTSLLELMIFNCRFCPIWHFPPVPLSEAVLVSIKTGRYHQDFLLALQDVSGEKLSMSQPELFYQLYENSLRYTCPLEDPAGARSRAMEAMLREKGWTWNDVANRMTSPLSPRDSDGWLIQQPFLGVRMEFAELKGFCFNLDPDCPSIEIIAVEADNSKGRVGLFSMQDVQTVLQLDESDLYPIFFSLDSPNENQRFHPFQQFRYKTEKLQKTPLLHTLFETDYLLKSFSVGSEVSAKPPFDQRPCKEGLTKNLPTHLQEAVKPVADRGKTLSNINRFWIQAEELVYDQTQDGSKLTVRLGDLKMKICSHPLLPGPDGKLQDTDRETDPDSPEAKFADDLTSHYSELGLHFPMFARLRELAKLQLFGLILKSVLDDMKNKAEGKGVEVPSELLTDIQQSARQRFRTHVDDVLRNLDREVGTWPAADDYSEISSLTQKMMDDLPYNVRYQASYSDVKPFAIKALQNKDDNVLSQVVDGLMQLCEHWISRSTLETSVRQWLSSRNSSASSELKSLLCRHTPLPTSEDIKRQIVDHHRQKYSVFKGKVNIISPQPDKNPCKWVPAALLTEEDMDSSRLCYGGVLIAPNIKSGHIPNLSSMNSRNVPIRHTGTLFHNPPTKSSFRAPFTKSVPAGEAGSTRIEGTGASVKSRLTNPVHYAERSDSSANQPVLKTFQGNLNTESNRRDDNNGDRRGGGKGEAAALAAPLLIARSAQQDDNKPNQRVAEQRKTAQQQDPSWLTSKRNNIWFQTPGPQGRQVSISPCNERDKNTSNVVYGLYSEKTGKLEYIGKTERSLGKRIPEHARDIRKRSKKTDLVKFFNSENHSLDDMRVCVLENVKPGDNIKQREMEWMLKCFTKDTASNMRYPIAMRKYRQLVQSE